MSSVPEDRFTPHGYLDNPFHTRNLHPSGVIRSSEGVGVAWHYPALARGYGFREVYRCAVEIALVDPVSGGASRIGLEDLHADVHTCNRLRFRFGALGLRVAATFHRIGEHALACRLELSNPAGGDRRVRVSALARYARHLGAAGAWGESGLVCLEEAGTLVVQGFEDGDAFALLADRAADTIGAWAPATQGVPSGSEVAERTIAALPPAEALRAPELTNGDHAVVTGRRGETVTLTGIAAYDVSVPAGGHSHLDVVLARHIRRDLAARRAHDALARRHEALADARTADERFWRQAPALEGDWPDAWRRGFAVDLETLRMMVRSPIGVYAHVWDGMQVHAPRAVLAEAAIDALLLGYADPDIGKALLLGTFLDAPAPNVPCSREDGSYNMVGANGSACGTAPEWGYPVEVARQLYRLAPDQAWLAALYPALARFLRWWLAERCDAQGYLVYDNSWESGQDLSARFGPQKEGGGSTIRMVRPVDLQAAMASACGSMVYFAQELGRPDEAHTWAEEERAFRERTEALWHDGAYRDFDARVGFSDEWDVMQLAPLALGLAPSARARAARAERSAARRGTLPLADVRLDGGRRGAPGRPARRGRARRVRHRGASLGHLGQARGGPGRAPPRRDLRVLGGRRPLRRRGVWLGRVRDPPPGAGTAGFPPGGRSAPPPARAARRDARSRPQLPRDQPPLVRRSRERDPDGGRRRRRRARPHPQ